uniref:Uncharacterized protein n=1 Tax=Brassica oleracea var. oleracea TaxID=109376 RepID=A0A0D3BKF8_BRAOL
MAIVSSLPLLAQGRTLGSLAYLPNSKLGSVLQECDIATMIKATVESLEGQLCSNEVMVRHELGQRISQTAMSDVLRETHFILLKNTEAKKARCYIKRWCKETGVCEPVTGNVQGTELPEECDDDLLEKTK